MKKNIVLVIATHPDDEVLGCGGSIARCAKAGDEVHVLVVTRGIPELFCAEKIEHTRKELAAAHKVLGVLKAHFLDFPAPKLDMVPAYELAGAIGRIIAIVKPSIVYLPHGGDIHVDHKSVYYAGLVAARPINGCSVMRILSYETLSETEWASPSASEAFIPSVFVDITNDLEIKLEAMACYQSQLKSSPSSRSLRSIKNLAQLRGGTVSLAAAEAFMLVRDIV